MKRPKGATEKSLRGQFIQGGILRSYCPIREEIPRRFALLAPAKLRRNDTDLLLQTLKAKPHCGNDKGRQAGASGFPLSRE